MLGWGEKEPAVPWAIRPKVIHPVSHISEPSSPSPELSWSRPASYSTHSSAALPAVLWSRCHRCLCKQGHLWTVTSSLERNSALGWWGCRAAAFHVTFMAILAGGSGTGLLVLQVLPASLLAPACSMFPFSSWSLLTLKLASVSGYQTSCIEKY